MTKTVKRKSIDLDKLLDKFDEAVETITEEEKEKVDPLTQKYQIRAVVNRADLLADPESAELFIGFDDIENEDGTKESAEEQVKQTLQGFNGFRSTLGDIDVTITGKDGSTYEPWDFGMPKPSTYKNRIAQKVGKVIEGEGFRDQFEDLLEFMCVKPFTAWDIMEALDEVFDEDEGAAIPQASGFNSEIGVAIDLVNQTNGLSREAFENMLTVMISKRWKSHNITEALDEVFGEWKADVAIGDVAFYDMTDKKVQNARNAESLSKKEFIKALKEKVTE